jgi:antitoxin (DNA-binding transcriptional repressor) of toxin-antitoxin stability system
MLMMTVEFFEARKRMHEVVDAVQQGREVMVMHFGAPLATLRLHGPPGEEAPRGWLESVVREGFDMMAQRMCNHGILPPLFVN